MATYGQTTAQIHPKLGRSWTKFGPMWVKVGRPRFTSVRNWLTLRRARPRFGRSRPNAAEFDQSRPTPAKNVKHTSKNGRPRPGVGRIRPTLAEWDPNLVNLSPNLDIDRNWSKCVRVRSDVGPIWDSLGRTRDKYVRRWLKTTVSPPLAIGGDDEDAMARL